MTPAYEYRLATLVGSRASRETNLFELAEESFDIVGQDLDTSPRHDCAAVSWECLLAPGRVLVDARLNVRAFQKLDMLNLVPAEKALVVGELVGGNGRKALRVDEVPKRVEGPTGAEAVSEGETGADVVEGSSETESEGSDVEGDVDAGGGGEGGEGDFGREEEGSTRLSGSVAEFTWKVNVGRRTGEVEQERRNEGTTGRVSDHDNLGGRDWRRKKVSVPKPSKSGDEEDVPPSVLTR